MPSNLHATNVKLPSPARSPCPLIALVTVANDGPDPTDGTAFDVTIEVLTSVDGNATAKFVAIVPTPEGAHLGPGKTTDVPVTIQLPCSSGVLLRTTVDVGRTVPNDLHSLPPLLQVVTPSPVPVPWLAASIQVGLRDGAGLVTMDPPSLCPGMTLVVMITTENVGCAPSQPTTNEVRLEQTGPGSSTTLLSSQLYSVPAIPAHTKQVAVVDFALPGPALAPATLTVRVNADQAVMNPSQCDRSKLSASLSKPLETGNPPRLSLGPLPVSIHPGLPVNLEWSFENDCTEIGLSTVRVLLGPHAEELTREDNVAIGPHSSIKRSVNLDATTLSSTQLSNDFWSIGVKTLTLEVLGTGGMPGPYTVTASLSVVAEPIDETWWFWTSATQVSWKTSYPVAGSFFNRSSSASFSLTALTFVEHPLDVAGTGSDITRTPRTLPLGLSFGSLAVSSAFIQTWEWISSASAPTRRIFRYVAHYTVTDAFTNTYSGLLSPPLDVTVSVSPQKLLDRQTATAYFAAGANMVVGGAITAYWFPPAGIASMAAGMALIIGATLLTYDAMDPPIPDFGSMSRFVLDVEGWKLGVDDDPRLHSLRTLLIVCGRCLRARAEALHARDRTWAAYIERDERAWTQARERIGFHLETMRRSIEAIAAAADESSVTWAEITAETRRRVEAHQISGWDGSRDFILKTVRAAAAELGLTPQELALVEEGVRRLEEHQLSSAWDDFLGRGLSDIGPAFSALYSLTQTELSEGAYLLHA